MPSPSPFIAPRQRGLAGAPWRRARAVPREVLGLTWQRRQGAICEQIQSLAVVCCNKATKRCGMDVRNIARHNNGCYDLHIGCRCNPTMSPPPSSFGVDSSPEIFRAIFLVRPGIGAMQPGEGVLTPGDGSGYTGGLARVGSRYLPAHGDPFNGRYTSSFRLVFRSRGYLVGALVWSRLV